MTHPLISGAMNIPDRMRSLRESLAEIPQFKRGMVWCHKCGHSQKVDAVECTLRTGWPDHCGQTMSLDEPRTLSQGKTTTS